MRSVFFFKHKPLLDQPVKLYCIKQEQLALGEYILRIGAVPAVFICRGFELSITSVLLRTTAAIYHIRSKCRQMRRHGTYATDRFRRDDVTPPQRAQTR